jgi:hypothetical protein
VLRPIRVIYLDLAAQPVASTLSHCAHSVKLFCLWSGSAHTLNGCRASLPGGGDPEEREAGAGSAHSFPTAGTGIACPRLTEARAGGARPGPGSASSPKASATAPPPREETEMMLRKVCTGLTLLAVVLMTGCCCHRCCRRPFLRRCCCAPECCAPTCCYPPAEPCCAGPAPVLDHGFSSPPPPVPEAVGAKAR